MKTRKAFTLTELLVVVFVIVALAAMTAAVLPGILAGNHIHRAADQLSIYLATARQQAIRDGLSTGVRLITTEGITNAVQLVQEPDGAVPGLYVGYTPETLTQNAVAMFRLHARSDGTETAFTDESMYVKPGDYLLINGDSPRAIVKVGPQYLTLSKLFTPLPGEILPVLSPREYVPIPEGQPANYKLLRRARPIAYEPMLVFPVGVGIDVGMCRGLSKVGDSYEMLFGANGNLVHSAAKGNQAIFWLRNITQSSTDKGSPLLITVQPRTGFIATHPVSLGSDPYQFTKDARSSGM